MTGFARKADDDQVGPAVVIDVGGKAGEALAVAGGPVAEIAGRADFVHRPIRGLVPNVAYQDVELAISIHVGDRDAFGAEHSINLRLLPSNGRLVRIAQLPG